MADAKEGAKKMAAARAARDRVLNGRTTVERGIEKLDQALLWVYRWGWSAPQLLDELAGTHRRGLTARLIRQRLLCASEIEGGGIISGIPQRIVGLTADGRAWIEEGYERHLPAIDPDRVRRDRIRHDLLVQRLTHHALKTKRIDRYGTPLEMPMFSRANQKQPDAAWGNGKERCAIELELTRKFDRDLDQFVERYVQIFEEQTPIYDRLKLFTVSPALHQAYTKAFETDALFYHWEKDRRGHWIRTQELGVSREACCFTEVIMCERDGPWPARASAP